jgi:SAM-dependent methyltransferase
MLVRMQTEALAAIAARLESPRYPRSSRYDAGWHIENMMGPSSLWLTEALTNVMPLTRGERIMDLGCGRGSSSVFLAREFDVRVDAVDLWIAAAENEQRFEAAGLKERVTAIDGDAADLPFADGTFDAIVSVDAYHYFGTGRGALADVVKLLKPGGRLGVVVPGLRYEVDQWPAPLMPYWQDGFETFHSPVWWKQLWEQDGLEQLECCDLIPNGAEDWLVWTEACDDWARLEHRAPYEEEARMLRADRDRLLGFVRLVATRR